MNQVYQYIDSPNGSFDPGAPIMGIVEMDLIAIPLRLRLSRRLYPLFC